MGVQKPRKDPTTGLSPSTHYPILEEQLVHLFIKAMDEVEEAFRHTSERDRETAFPDSNISLLWWNLSSELIFFLLYQFVTFTTFVESIHKTLSERSFIGMKEGRDFLMWALLQFISGSIGMPINVFSQFFCIFNKKNNLFFSQKYYNRLHASPQVIFLI